METLKLYKLEWCYTKIDKKIKVRQLLRDNLCLSRKLERRNCQLKNHVNKVSLTYTEKKSKVYYKNRIETIKQQCERRLKELKDDITYYKNKLEIESVAEKEDIKFEETETFF